MGKKLTKKVAEENAPITFETIVSFMEKYKIKEMPLFYENKQFIGTLSKDGKYIVNRYTFRTLSAKGTEADAIAQKIAIENFPIVKKLFDLLKNEMEVEVDYYNDYKYSRTEKVSGTLETILNQHDRDNNKLRYCNGSYYKFKDEEYETFFLFWLKFASATQLFWNFYGGGIVD